MGTGAVSRYKFDRSQKTVTVQDYNCGQVRALTAVASAKAGVRVQVLAGFVTGAGFAKTMTSPLIIPSVLCCVVCPELLQGMRSLKVL